MHNSLQIFREYLLGFRKRKNERRKKAQEQLQKQEHEKKKQLRVEVKFEDHMCNSLCRKYFLQFKFLLVFPMLLFISEKEDVP